MLDPNTLLSTVIQSAATFVAIIAGFIVSRLMALSADRNGLENKLREIKVQKEIKVNSRNSIQKAKLHSAISHLLNQDEVEDKMIASRGEISLAESINDVIDNPISPDDIRPQWETRIKAIKDSNRILDEFGYKIPDDKNEEILFLRSKGLDPTDDAYGIYMLVRQVWLRTRKHQVNAFLNNNFKLDFSSLATYSLPSISPPIVPSPRGTYQEEIDSLQSEIDELEAHEFDLIGQIKKIGVPQDVGLGLGILGYLTVAGIIVPLIFLPMDQEQFTPFFKWIIYGLFIAGLIAFSYYLFRLYRHLTKSPD